MCRQTSALLARRLRVTALGSPQGWRLNSAGLLGVAVALTLPLSVVAMGVEPPAASAAASAGAEPVAVDVGPTRELSTETSTTVRESDGSLTMTTYNEPVNYRADSEGPWVPIDNTLVESPGEVYDVENAANSFVVKIPEDAAATPIKVIDDGAWVTMRMHGVADPVADVEDETAVYDEVAGADGVTYEVVNSGIKESIKLNAPPASAIRYTYTLDSSDGLRPEVLEDGGIAFLDVNDETQFAIPAGFMYDSTNPEPVFSDSVAFDLKVAGDGWRLIVTPNLEWLLDPERRYPVIVDPSLVSDPASRDCWINSLDADATSCGLATTGLRVGKTQTMRRRALINFDVSGIPNGATVSSASIDLHLDASATTTGTSAEYAFYTPKRSMMGTPTPTWNNSASGAWTGGCTCGSKAYGQRTLTGMGASEYKTFSGMGDLVQGWVDGSSPTKGLVLKQVSETIENSLRFYSSSSNTVNNGKRPYLTVNYVTSTPRIPTTISITPGGQGYVESLRPLIAARVSSPTGDLVRLRGVVESASGARIFSGASTYVSSGSIATLQLPSGVLSDDANYAVRLSTESAVASSPSVDRDLLVIIDSTADDDFGPSLFPGEPADSSLVTRAMHEAMLSCMKTAELAPGSATVESSFGVWNNDGTHSPATHPLPITSGCAFGALDFVEEHLMRASTDSEIEILLEEAAVNARDYPATVPMGVSGSESVDPAAVREVDDAGNFVLPPDPGDASCVTPNHAYQFIFGSTEPRFRGMGELIKKKMARFNSLREAKTPCFYNWNSDGCSVPEELGNPEPAFMASCLRHDWGYRNLQRAEIWYDEDTWMQYNKSVVDTRFYVDMHNKCDAMNLSSFETRRCRNKAFAYYTVVAYFGWDTFKDWNYYFILP